MGAQGEGLDRRRPIQSESFSNVDVGSGGLWQVLLEEAHMNKTNQGTHAGRTRGRQGMGVLSIGAVLLRTLSTTTVLGASAARAWRFSCLTLPRLTSPPQPYRGQYSDAVLSELENQNDAHVEGISAKVKMLKDVCEPPILLQPLIPSNAAELTSAFSSDYNSDRR